MVDVLNIKERLMEIMKAIPETKDNDQLLLANVWLKELATAKIDAKKMSAFDFILQFSKDKWTNSESVTRCRRKIQEEMPQFRGKSWKSRHDNEGNVINDLNKF
jgi:hypothetical protein